MNMDEIERRGISREEAERRRLERAAQHHAAAHLKPAAPAGNGSGVDLVESGMRQYQQLIAERDKLQIELREQQDDYRDLRATYDAQTSQLATLESRMHALTAQRDQAVVERAHFAAVVANIVAITDRLKLEPLAADPTLVPKREAPAKRPAQDVVREDDE